MLRAELARREEEHADTRNDQIHGEEILSVAEKLRSLSSTCNQLRTEQHQIKAMVNAFTNEIGKGVQNLQSHYRDKLLVRSLITCAIAFSP